MPKFASYLLPILLLLCSNIFMTFAWYGHLREKGVPLWKAIAVSWAIALFEYILMVPANRIGIKVYDVFHLKIIQEVITLCVFCWFASTYLDQKLKWNHLVACLFLLGAVFFVFKKWD